MTTSKHNTIPAPAFIGIDLAKRSLHVYGVDARGQVCVDRRMSPQRAKALLSTLAPCIIGLEACGRSHHWARVVQGDGHEVRLMAPQFVKPYVKSNKNDRADAEAICEAVQRPNMRFVGIKRAAQQAQQALHRARSRAVANRTAHVNEIRGLLAEYGIEIAQGRHKVRPALAGILGCGGTAEVELEPLFLDVLGESYEELVHMEARVERYDAMIEAMAHSDAQVRLLMTIPGIGPMGATALLAGGHR